MILISAYEVCADVQLRNVWLLDEDGFADEEAIKGYQLYSCEDLVLLESVKSRTWRTGFFLQEKKRNNMQVVADFGKYKGRPVKEVNKYILGKELLR
ncbi:hypothetical protein [Cytobacillus sp. NCCP-133]|uniref:hypothetical protein n=1 Tax=Cytobacillus sp. NCCP-133 TaxID=766848 RepID=UPI00222EECF6|nr:hypothetical protein [Cytobacillus sp. NCCP-133]GLB59016.1 hypothetical protein NCCP133_11490 [Cytobacillus sp. NCCP-133]